MTGETVNFFFQFVFRNGTNSKSEMRRRYNVFLQCSSIVLTILISLHFVNGDSDLLFAPKIQKQLFDSAKAALQRRNFQESLLSLSQSISYSQQNNNSTNSDYIEYSSYTKRALALRARVYSAMGKFDKALKDHRDAGESRETMKLARLRLKHLNKAIMAHATGKYGTAFDIVTSLIKNGAMESERLYLLRAECSLWLGNYASVRSDASRVLKSDRLNTRAIFLIAKVMYTSIGNVEAARKNLEYCIKLSPDDKSCVKAHRKLRHVDQFWSVGLDLFKSGNYTDAIKSFKQVFEADPTTPLRTQVLEKICLAYGEIRARVKVSLDEAKETCMDAVTALRATGDLTDVSPPLQAWQQNQCSNLVDDNRHRLRLFVQLATAELPWQIEASKGLQGDGVIVEQTSIIRKTAIKFSMPLAYLEREGENEVASNPSGVSSVEAAVKLFKMQIPRQLLSGPFFPLPKSLQRTFEIKSENVENKLKKEPICENDASIVENPGRPLQPEEVVVGYLVDVSRDSIGRITRKSLKYLRQALLSISSLRWFGGSISTSRVLVLVTPSVPASFRARVREFGGIVRVVSPLSKDAGYSHVTPHSNKLRLLQEPEAKGHNGTRLLLYLDCDVIVTGDPMPFLSPDRIQYRAGRTVWGQMILDDKNIMDFVFKKAGIGKEASGHAPSRLLVDQIGWPNTGVIAFPTGNIGYYDDCASCSSGGGTCKEALSNETLDKKTNTCFAYEFGDVWLQYTSSVAAGLREKEASPYFAETLSFILALAHCKYMTDKSSTRKTTKITFEELPIQMNLQLNMPLLDFRKNGFDLSLAQEGGNPVLVQHTMATLHSQQGVNWKLQPYDSSTTKQFPFLPWINTNFISTYNKLVELNGGHVSLGVVTYEEENITEPTENSDPNTHNYNIDNIETELMNLISGWASAASKT